MVIRDCHCMMRDGRPSPNCILCCGSGIAPPNADEIKTMRKAALETIAKHGDTELERRESLRGLAKDGDHVRLAIKNDRP